MSAPLVRVRNVILALVLLLVALPVRAQEPQQERPIVPWGVGERLEYDLKFGFLKVGSGSMEVADVQDMRGRESWHTKFEVRAVGRSPIASTTPTKAGSTRTPATRCASGRTSTKAASTSIECSFFLLSAASSP